MDCKHRKLTVAWERKKFACNDDFDCRKFITPHHGVVISREHYQSLQDVVEHFAQLLCDNPDLVGELCVCEGYEAGLDNLGQACPICDDRSPLWIRGQEINALEKDQRSDSK